MLKRFLTVGILLMLGLSSAQQLEFVTTSLAPTFNDFFEPLVERANKQFGTSVKWTDLPQNAIQQKVLAGIAAGNPRTRCSSTPRRSSSSPSRAPCCR